MFIRRFLKQSIPTSIIGLDIGSDDIKLLQINSTETPGQLENFAISPLPPNVIVKDEVKDLNVAVNVLKELVRESGAKSKHVALAIPRSSVIIKNISIDGRLNSSEIESRAWIEANRYFPDLVGDIYLDFNILGPSPQDDTQLELMLVACRKEQIKPYLEIVRQSGLNAKVVDVNCYALERALALTQPEATVQETTALLNLNFTLSSFIVSRDKQLLYAHDHSYDGQRLINQVRKHFNQEAANVSEPVVANNAVDNTLLREIFKDNLSSHLRHTMHFFYSSRPNVNIQKIILSGDCATIPELAAFIQQEVSIETVTANPFRAMPIGHEVDREKLQTYAPRLMLSLGLALSQVK